MPACKAGRVTDSYSYHYIYIVIFGFPVEIKAHKSGDLNGNKTPEAEVPEGTDGPHQFIGQVLQVEREKKRLQRCTYCTQPDGVPSLGCS